MSLHIEYDVLCAWTQWVLTRRGCPLTFSDCSVVWQVPDLWRSRFCVSFVWSYLLRTKLSALRMLVIHVCVGVLCEMIIFFSIPMILWLTKLFPFVFLWFMHTIKPLHFYLSGRLCWPAPSVASGGPPSSEYSTQQSSQRSIPYCNHESLWKSYTALSCGTKQTKPELLAPGVLFFIVRSLSLVWLPRMTYWDRVLFYAAPIFSIGIASFASLPCTGTWRIRDIPILIVSYD